MDFKNNKSNWSAILGFVVTYFVFTTIFYFIIKISDKMPAGWNYLYAIMITLTIVLIGKLLQLWLK